MKTQSKEPPAGTSDSSSQINLQHKYTRPHQPVKWEDRPVKQGTFRNTAHLKCLNLPFGPVTTPLAVVLATDPFPDLPPCGRFLPERPAADAPFESAVGLFILGAMTAIAIYVGLPLTLAALKGGA